MKVTSDIATRLMYTTIFILLSVIAWVFSWEAYTFYDEFLHYIPKIAECTEETCGSYYVYRISFSLFVFHFLLALMVTGVTSPKEIRAHLNNSLWPLKIPALVILLIATLWIPNVFFQYYAWMAIFGAGAFILIQLVLLVDLAYSWSESWVSKWQGDGLEENRVYLYALLIVTGLLYLIAMAFDGLMYGLFCTGDCWWNALIITSVLLMCLAISIISIIPKIHEFNPRAGLLQAAIFTVYCTYYVYSAILSEPTCGDLPFSWAQDYSTTTSDYLTLIFGALFTIISVVYCSLRAGSADFIPAPQPEEEKTKYSFEEDDGATENLITEEEEEESGYEYTSYSYALFHLAFALGAMYVGMLLTNWSIITGESDTASTDSGWVSVTVKLVSCALAGILYLWTVFAPAILSGRDWD